MNLEIRWDNELHYIQANNYYEGCIKTIKEFVEENHNEDIPISTFLVTNLDNMDSCEIGMEIVVAIMAAANNYEDEPVEV